MSWSSIASAKKDGDGSATITTSAIDTTGADLLLAFGGYVMGVTPTISDSKSNTWNDLGEYSGFGRVGRIYWCKPSSVGSGHTFSFAANFSFPWIGVAAFSGSHATPYDGTVHGHAFSSTTSDQPGSITPANADCLMFTGIMMGDNTGLAIDGSFSILQQGASGGGYPGGIAYKVLSGTPATNPTWSWTNSTSGSCIQAPFKPAASSSAVTQPIQALLLACSGGQI